MVTIMDDEAERRYNVIAEARETRDRLADVEVRRNDVETWIARKPDIVTQPGEFNRWLASQPEEQEPEPAPPPAPTMAEIEPPPLPNYTFTDAEIARMFVSVQADFDSKLAAAVKARVSWEQARQDATGDALSKIRKQLRDEFQEQLGLLRADIEIMTKHAERRERGDVVEVPQFLQRRRHA
jgi:hypothetical protein